MSTSAPSSFAALAVACALAAGLPASAQDVTPASPAGAPDSTTTGAAVGLSLERFMVPDAEGGFTLLTAHVDGLRKGGGVGLDLAVATPPRALAQGAFVGLAELGPVLSSRNKQTTFLVRTGGSVFGCACEDGEAVVGGYLGVAALLPISKGAGLRIDVTPRVFLEDHEAVTTWTVGLGITSLPRLERIFAHEQ